MTTELSSATVVVAAVTHVQLVLCWCLPLASIPPAFEWAQSADAVFLNVKFSHKWDTPSTLGCVEERVNITNGSFVVDIVCKEKGKKFLLALDVYGELNPEVGW